MRQIGDRRIARAAFWRAPRPLAERPRFRSPTAARVGRGDLLAVRDVREIGQALVGSIVPVVARVRVYFLVVEDRHGLGRGTGEREQGAERRQSAPEHRHAAGVFEGFHFQVLCRSSEYTTRSLYRSKKGTEF